MPEVLDLDLSHAQKPIEFTLPHLRTTRPTTFLLRDQLPAQVLATEAPTLGWDTVFAVRLPDVNSALMKSDKYPKTFEITVDPSENYSIQGTFGSWQVARGGDGKIVYLSIPIPTGTMTSGTKSYPLDGSQVYISVNLKYVPQKQGSNALKASDSDVEVDDLVVNPEARSEEDPAVVIQNLKFAQNPPSTFIKSLMIGALLEWFNANLIQFAYVFSTVNLNERADQEQFQWLKPTYTSYGYSDGATDEKSYFGVLNMTDDRSPEGLENHLPPAAIPEEARASFSIAMERFLEKMVLPGLPKGFPNASDTDFTLANNNTVIQNTRTVIADKIKVGLIWYTPEIETFELQVVGNEIQIHTITKVNISPGIDTFVDNTSYQEIIVVNKPDGSQTLDFKQTRDPRTNHWVKTATWVTVTEIIISVAGTIALGVAGTVIKGIARTIVAVVIIALVAGFAAATPALIAAVAGGEAGEKLPSIDLLVLNSTAPIKWPGASEFKLTSAGLNGSFQMGGDPGFTI
ncbi:TULIP family P47-like protein [Gloeocapsopsis sp. IPPAS B-1203]|uniref:TULIP family P47-like protein n=1 Tax=Gloeocapsopsis sp. IPPAS B-1203 TaxID=2049454 RepID=UPI000C176EAD|nr:TULIP family P47-like protein [Gloeocapsopsis sp. IPPAS B-1203]PIG95165.1 hypothetical protein CSQ79_01465 [Gloeocapsopsis sp. IPPAS B-1203]